MHSFTYCFFKSYLVRVNVFGRFWTPSTYHNPVRSLEPNYAKTGTVGNTKRCPQDRIVILGPRRLRTPSTYRNPVRLKKNSRHYPYKENRSPGWTACATGWRRRRLVCIHEALPRPVLFLEKIVTLRMLNHQ